MLAEMMLISFLRLLGSKSILKIYISVLFNQSFEMSKLNEQSKFQFPINLSYLPQPLNSKCLPYYVRSRPLYLRLMGEFKQHMVSLAFNERNLDYIVLLGVKHVPFEQ